MLDYFALFLLFFVIIFLFYGIIALHDIPYEIAKKRNHPQQEAIHVAGWVSLFTLHVIWPFLWIWATLYQPGKGWGFLPEKVESLEQKELLLQNKESSIEQQLLQLKQEVAELKAQLNNKQQPSEEV